MNLNLKKTLAVDLRRLTLILRKKMIFNAFAQKLECLFGFCLLNLRKFALICGPTAVVRLNKLFTFAVFLGTVGVFIWGCQTSQPVTPYKNVALSVSVPATNEVKASLLGVASNELLYRVDGPGHSFLTSGTVGPFSTAASSGSIDFTANVPAKDNLVLSIQLNDASSNQPLAVGATGLNMFSAPVTDVVIEMGSVTRNCYTLNVPGGSLGGAVGEIYTFSTDSLLTNSPVLGDLQVNFNTGSTAPLTISGGPVSITGGAPFPPLPNLAYLGNGNFLDYDYIPPASAFQTTSDLAKGAPISVNDIFCLKLVSLPVNIGGGHAWIQVTNLGNGVSIIGPSFRYRVNGTLPYFAYEQTSADIAATCSTSW